MQYQRIRYFLQAAESGSFSRAAKQMYISPRLWQSRSAFWKRNWAAPCLSAPPRVFP